jgi:hypothetical protein
MSTRWVPLHENHAIEQMALVVSFQEPLPQLAWRKLIATHEEAVFSAGLKARNEVQGFQLAFGQDSGPPTQAPVNVMGFTYHATGDTPGAKTEQLEVNQSQIIYRNWRYVSWKFTTSRLISFLIPLLEAMAAIAQVASVRLEYLDRFRFDGKIGDATVSDLLRPDSSFISPHVYKEKGQWHNHTGKFLETYDGGGGRVLQIAMDSIDLASKPFEIPSQRWVHIMTAIEDRIVSTTGVVLRTFDSMAFQENLDRDHVALKYVLASIITDELAKRIYLEAESN